MNKFEHMEDFVNKLCEDPKKTHWKHFLELEMKAKKQREIDL